MVTPVTPETRERSLQACGCPPPWLPPTESCPERVVRCVHIDGSLRLLMFRHADLPRIYCVVRQPFAPALDRLGLDYESALAAFFAAEAELLGRAE